MSEMIHKEKCMQSHYSNTQVYSVHNVPFKKIRITISQVFSTNGKTNFQSGKYYRVSFQKIHEVIYSEAIVPIPEILHVTFPVQVILKAVDLKIEPPSTNLVTTACRLKTP